MLQLRCRMAGYSPPRTTEMKTLRTNQEWQRPLAFLAEAPMGWLVTRGEIRQFAADSVMSLDGELVEWAFLVLSGSCQLWRSSPGEEAGEILHCYNRGQTFGSFILPNTTLIAAED